MAEKYFGCSCVAYFSCKIAFDQFRRSCPLALEAAMGLLQLGQNATEVTSLMSVSMPSVGTFEWCAILTYTFKHVNCPTMSKIYSRCSLSSRLLNWLKAYALKATSKFTSTYMFDNNLFVGWF